MHISTDQVRVPTVSEALLLPFSVEPSNQKFEETRLFAWLSGRPFGPRAHHVAASRGGGVVERKRRAETKRQDASRSRVLNEILPLLYSLSDVVNPESGLGAFAKYASSEVRTSSEGRKGLYLRKLNDLVCKYSAFCHCDLDGHLHPYASGPKALELWATCVLVGMWEKGRLGRIGRCDCGCGRLIMKWRRDRRFFQPSCSVRWHQSDPEFKKKRNERARRSRQDAKIREAREPKRRAHISGSGNTPGVAGTFDTADILIYGRSSTGIGER